MSIGFGQIMLILIIVLILFGAGKLPSVMNDLAKGIRAFKKGLNEDESHALDQDKNKIDHSTSEQ